MVKLFGYLNSQRSENSLRHGRWSQKEVTTVCFLLRRNKQILELIYEILELNFNTV